MKVPASTEMLRTANRALCGRRRNMTSKAVANEIEAAIHEAAQAVIAIKLGGKIWGLALHRTKAERQANGGALASCGIYDLSSYDEAVAILAGPIAAAYLTRMIKRGEAYAYARYNVRKEVGADVHRIEARLSEAQTGARYLVNEHWSSIERVAALLIQTKFGNGFLGFKTDAIKKCFMPTNSFPAVTKAHLPSEVHWVWEEELEGYKRKETSKRARIAQKLRTAGEPYEIWCFSDEVDKKYAAEFVYI